MYNLLLFIHYLAGTVGTCRMSFNPQPVLMNIALGWYSTVEFNILCYQIFSNCWLEVVLDLNSKKEQVW